MVFIPMIESSIIGLIFLLVAQLCNIIICKNTSQYRFFFFRKKRLYYAGISVVGCKPVCCIPLKWVIDNMWRHASYCLAFLLFMFNMTVSGRNPSPMWDRLVFNKIKEKLGGRVRFMASGASPLSPDVMDFLRV